MLTREGFINLEYLSHLRKFLLLFLWILDIIVKYEYPIHYTIYKEERRIIKRGTEKCFLVKKIELNLQKPYCGTPISL